MSSPIYELLKRPDELFVVEHAHLNPRFVEDSVRLMLRGVLERYGEELDDGDFVHASQVNFETIHAHDVLAERVATIGELRAELETGSRSAEYSSLEAGFRTAADPVARQAELRTRLVTVQERAGRSPGAGRGLRRPRRS